MFRLSAGLQNTVLMICVFRPHLKKSNTIKLLPDRTLKAWFREIAAYYTQNMLMIHTTCQNEHLTHVCNCWASDFKTSLHSLGKAYHNILESGCGNSQFVFQFILLQQLDSPSLELWGLANLKKCILVTYFWHLRLANSEHLHPLLPESWDAV